MTKKIRQIKNWANNNSFLSPLCQKFYEYSIPFLTTSRIYHRVIHLVKEVEKDKGKIDIIQRELLIKLLKHALGNVPYYQKRVKIDPSYINSSNVFEVFKEFPLITKEEVRKNSKDFIPINKDLTELNYVTSGGSTGRGIGIWTDWEMDQVVRAFLDYNWGKYGYKKRSKMLFITRGSVVTKNQVPFNIKNRNLWVSPHHLSEKWLPQIVKAIQEFQPDFIRSIPSCLEILAGYIKQKNISIKFKGIFLSYEAVLPIQIDLFMEVFNAPVYAEYGACERVLLGQGCYNGKELHYHFNPIYGIIENYQDENGNHELVGTGLWNYAMPLIRYRTQDYGKISERQNNCKVCRKEWKTIFHLDGRKQEFLVTKQGTLYPGHSVKIDKFIWNHVKIFQFVQNAPGVVELHIVPNGNFTRNAEKKIVDAQKKRLAEWFDVILVKVDEILRTKAGKRGLVINNLVNKHDR